MVALELDMGRNGPAPRGWGRIGGPSGWSSSPCIGLCAWLRSLATMQQPLFLVTTVFFNRHLSCLISRHPLPHQAAPCQLMLHPLVGAYSTPADVTRAMLGELDAGPANPLKSRGVPTDPLSAERGIRWSFKT